MSNLLEIRGSGVGLITASAPVVAPSFDSVGGLRHPLVPAAAQTDFAQGLEFIGTGEPRRAATCLRRVLDMAPEFADGHVALGIAYAMQSRIYPALDHLERATRLEPANFFGHFKLGQLYFKLRIPRKGYDALSQALDCATSIGERKLVAQLIREEKQREHNGVRRPWWNKPFSRTALYLAASLAGIGGAMLLRSMHLH